jgi:hypothetical protein
MYNFQLHELSVADANPLQPQKEKALSRLSNQLALFSWRIRKYSCLL